MFRKLLACTLFTLLVYSVSARVASPAGLMPGTNGIQEDAIHEVIPAAAKKSRTPKPQAEKEKKPGRKYNIGVDYEQAWE